MYDLQFFMPMIPPSTTFQDKELAVRNGKPLIFDSAELIAVKAKLRGHLAKSVPPEPFRGPLRVLTKWCYPATEKHPAGTWKTTKPDTDNLQKALLDSMTKLGFWKDDAQVASEITEKFWANLPGILIYAEEIGVDV